MDARAGSANAQSLWAINRPNLSSTQEHPDLDMPSDTSSSSASTIPASRSFRWNLTVPKADREESAESGKRDVPEWRRSRHPRSATRNALPSFPIFNEDENDKDYMGSTSRSRPPAGGKTRNDSSDKVENGDDPDFNEAYPLRQVPGENRDYNAIYGKISPNGSNRQAFVAASCDAPRMTDDRIYTRI